MIGGEVEIDASASSQFVSALLLVGARIERGLDLRHVGTSSVPSMPHVDMTIAELRRRGVRVDAPQPNRWIVHPGTVDALDVEIEPDLSNAGVFIAGALVTGGRVRIRSWPRDTDQAGDAWRDDRPGVRRHRRGRTATTWCSRPARRCAGSSSTCTTSAS